MVCSRTEAREQAQGPEHQPRLTPQSPCLGSQGQDQAVWENTLQLLT